MVHAAASLQGCGGCGRGGLLPGRRGNDKENGRAARVPTLPWRAMTFTHLLTGTLRGGKTRVSSMTAGSKSSRSFDNRGAPKSLSWSRFSRCVNRVAWRGRVATRSSEARLRETGWGDLSTRALFVAEGLSPHPARAARDRPSPGGQGYRMWLMSSRRKASSQPARLTFWRMEMRAG